jgi:integrase
LRSAFPLPAGARSQTGIRYRIERVRRPAKLPVVFTPDEALAVIDQLQGDYRLMAGLLHGSGLRLMECVRLRVKDIDFAYGSITVRDGKGLRDRVTVLPEGLRRPLQLQLERVQRSIAAICRRMLAVSTFLMPCSVSIPRPIVPGPGSMYSRPISSLGIRGRVSFGAITFRKRISRTRSKAPLLA